MVLSSTKTVCAYSYYSSSSSSESESSAEPEDVQIANAPFVVGGTVIKTTVAGAYAAKSVQGTAVITSLADVKANLGLKGGQVPAITIYDTDPLKSPKALASINAAADALGAEVLTSLSIWKSGTQRRCSPIWQEQEGDPKTEVARSVETCCNKSDKDGSICPAWD